MCIVYVGWVVREWFGVDCMVCFGYFFAVMRCLPGALWVTVHAGPGEVGLPFGVWFVSWFAFYCRLLIHGGAYPALVHRLAIGLLFKSATVSDLDTGASAGYSLVFGLLVNLAYRWCLPALVTCEILLKKPIQPIAKHYAKWYDFAYILNQEGLKNQGVKNMCGVIDG